jgi:hypothetical protein
MAKTWGDVSKAVMQILGPQGKIPPEGSSGLTKAGAASQKSWAEFQAARKSLKDALDTLKENSANHLGALQAIVDDINTDNLGLDPKKNREDAKKIAAARKLLVGYWNEFVQLDEKQINDTKKLDAAVKIIMDAE